MLQIPSHVLASGHVGAPVSFEWHGTQDYNREMPKLLFRFEDVSIRGVLALATGIAEWTAWRFDGLTDYRSPLLFIEAMWAGNAADEYVVGWDWEREPKLESPVDRALMHTCDILLHVFNRCDPDSGADASQWTVYMTMLARHVLPERSRFETWLEAAMARLANDYPRLEGDPLGESVPRVSMEVDRPYDRAHAPRYLDDYLRSLNPAANPFLRKPRDMLRRGFRGVPYEYLRRVP